MAIVAFFINVITFLFVKLFPILLKIIDLHGCLAIFGIGCIIGTIFVFFILEETTGKSLDDVGLDEKTKMERVHTTRINSL